MKLSAQQVSVLMSLYEAGGASIRDRQRFEGLRHWRHTLYALRRRSLVAYDVRLGCYCLSTNGYEAVNEIKSRHDQTL